MNRRFMHLICFALLIATLASCSGTSSEFSEGPDISYDTEQSPRDSTPNETTDNNLGIPSVSTPIPNESDINETNNSDEKSQGSDYSKLTYDELKAEFEKNIERARQKPVDDNNIYLHQWECLLIFEEMLNHRQSLDDFSEYVEFPYETYTGYTVSVNVDSVFSDGKTTYRILKFTAHRYIRRRMYIQIYDEETLISQYVYGYLVEGGIGGEIVYSGFQQEQNKTYFAIVHREDTPTTTNYYLINYEIDGKVFHKYNALRDEVRKGIWTISEADYWSDGAMNIRVSYSDWSEEESWWTFSGVENHASFENNKLTIVLENEYKDEISLIFENGFWEVAD